MSNEERMMDRPLSIRFGKDSADANDIYLMLSGGDELAWNELAPNWLEDYLSGKVGVELYHFQKDKREYRPFCTMQLNSHPGYERQKPLSLDTLIYLLGASTLGQDLEIPQELHSPFGSNFHGVTV
jgi:hypothetical protein